MGASVDYKRVTGVYAIEVKELKKVYVGQSVNAPNRMRQHKSVLQNGKSKNKELQADWNAGHKFDFILLEECYNKDLLKKETDRTRQYVKDGWYVYNVCIVSETVIVNIPPEHKDFVYALLKAIDSGSVTKEQVINIFKL